MRYAPAREDGLKPSKGSMLMLAHWRGQHDTYDYDARAASECPMCEQVNNEVDLRRRRAMQDDMAVHPEGGDSANA